MTKEEYNKEYYKKNKRKIQKLQARWRENNQEYVRKTSAEWYSKNKQHVKEYVKRTKKTRDKVFARRRKNHPETFLLTWARQRANRFSLPFNLTIADIFVPKFCPVLGLKLKTGKRGNPTSPSLDRIKPWLGYVKGNVAVISRRANFLKNDATLEELQALVKYLQEKS
jgi:hypothetical protein